MHKMKTPTMRGCTAGAKVTITTGPDFTRPIGGPQYLVEIKERHKLTEIPEKAGIIAAGCGSPKEKAQQPRQTIGSGFFMPQGCAGHGFAYVGPCGWHRKVRRYLFPVFQRPHGLSPTLEAMVAGLQPVEKEPTMATPTRTPSMGNTASPSTTSDLDKDKTIRELRMALADCHSLASDATEQIAAIARLATIGLDSGEPMMGRTVHAALQAIRTLACDTRDGIAGLAADEMEV